MTDLELKKLKDDLWHSADILRSGAHIAANKYGQPILGLIFLRYADILFKQHKDEIDKEYFSKKGSRAERTYKEICVEKCGFYFPQHYIEKVDYTLDECAYFESINKYPDTALKATVIKEAMQTIEDENPRLQGVLPKEVYGQLVPEEEPELLSRVVRIFKDIPENIEIDLFGEIYEFFLGEFALSEGKDGGTFYTPATVVRYMVEVIKPEEAPLTFWVLGNIAFATSAFLSGLRYFYSYNPIFLSIFGICVNLFDSLSFFNFFNSSISLLQFLIFNNIVFSSYKKEGSIPIDKYFLFSTYCLLFMYLRVTYPIPN